jgi:hypothetical protein
MLNLGDTAMDSNHLTAGAMLANTFAVVIEVVSMPKVMAACLCTIVVNEPWRSKAASPYQAYLADTSMDSEATTCAACDQGYECEFGTVQLTTDGVHVPGTELTPYRVLLPDTDAYV